MACSPTAVNTVSRITLLTPSTTTSTSSQLGSMDVVHTLGLSRVNGSNLVSKVSARTCKPSAIQPSSHKNQPHAPRGGRSIPFRENRKTGDDATYDRLQRLFHLLSRVTSLWSATAFLFGSHCYKEGKLLTFLPFVGLGSRRTVVRFALTFWHWWETEKQSELSQGAKKSNKACRFLSQAVRMRAVLDAGLPFLSFSSKNCAKPSAESSIPLCYLRASLSCLLCLLCLQSSGYT